MRGKCGRQSPEDACGYSDGFPIFGPSGRSNPGGNPPRYNARNYLPGVNDGDLPAELFDVALVGRPQIACQEQCQPGIQMGRIPTLEWEMAFLGINNSRFRQLDPAPNSDLAVHRINARPFRDEVAFLWAQNFLVTQEVYRQYNGPNADRWEEEGG